MLQWDIRMWLLRNKKLAVHQNPAGVCFVNVKRKWTSNFGWWGCKKRPDRNHRTAYDDIPAKTSSWFASSSKNHFYGSVRRNIFPRIVVMRSRENGCLCEGGNIGLIQHKLLLGVCQRMLVYTRILTR